MDLPHEGKEYSYLGTADSSLENWAEACLKQKMFLESYQKKKADVDFGSRKVIRLSMAVACLAPFGAMMPVSSARAQMSANCIQVMDFGNFALASPVGTLTITPGGSVPNKPSIITLKAPKEGICKVSFTGTTGSLQIQMSKASTPLTGMGDKLTVLNFNIDTKNAGRTKTYTSASLVQPSMNYNIGAALRADDSDTAGSYSGSVIIIHTYTN